MSDDNISHPHTGLGCRDCWQLRLIAQGNTPDEVILDDMNPDHFRAETIGEWVEDGNT